MTRSTLIAILAGVASVAAPPSSRAVDALSRLVEEAEEQTRLLTPLRADLRMAIDGLEGKSTERAIWLFRNAPSGNGIDLYVEFRRSGRKVLALADGRAFVVHGGKAEAARRSTEIGTATWTVEDLLPFDAGACLALQIADIQPERMTLTCGPREEIGSQYSLVVYKFDREKAVPTQRLFYKDTLNNLVKMRTDSGVRLVGRRWRPAKIVMQDFKLRTKDVFELEWRQDPKFRPEIFEPASLAEPSGLEW